MKIDNFIYTGDSYPAGDGFGDGVTSIFAPNENEEYKFAHPELKKYFTEPYTRINIMNQIQELSFPSLVGKKLNCPNVVNLSRAGLGHETHMRTVMSYVFTNLEKLKKEKTVICFDITDYARIELTKSNSDYKIDIDVSNDIDGYNGYFFKNYYHEAHRIIQYITQLYFFKGWVENNGFDFFIFSTHESSFFNNFNLPDDKLEEYEIDVNCQFSGPIYVKYPSIKSVIDSLNIIDVRIKEKTGTFLLDGYHHDLHFSPKGHEIVTNNIYNFFKEYYKL
jgi:hypothetical protein